MRHAHKHDVIEQVGSDLRHLALVPFFYLAKHSLEQQLPLSHGSCLGRQLDAKGVQIEALLDLLQQDGLFLRPRCLIGQRNKTLAFNQGFLEIHRFFSLFVSILKDLLD
eukprot:Lithocolla_globosa_v1_NODE_1976_length_2233_cov_7.825528.p3 type:complete len:109 gc:universal NODE_1976_length_2233_cov_7.825528:842-1168(+)